MPSHTDPRTGRSTAAGDPDDVQAIERILAAWQAEDEPTRRSPRVIAQQIHDLYARELKHLKDLVKR